MITSKKYTLDLPDAGKGLLVATGGAVLTAVQASLDAGHLILNWKQIAMAGIGAGVAYLIKNFFTPAKKVVKHTI